MKRALLIMVTCILSVSPLAQESPTTPKARRLQIIQGPKIELGRGNLTIISWTTNNPGGSPVHYGIVHYGTDPHGLTETAKSPIRLNPEHASTVFRVRLDNLNRLRKNAELSVLRSCRSFFSPSLQPGLR